MAFSRAQKKAWAQGMARKRALAAQDCPVCGRRAYRSEGAARDALGVTPDGVRVWKCDGGGWHVARRRRRS